MAVLNLKRCLGFAALLAQTQLIAAQSSSSSSGASTVTSSGNAEESLLAGSASYLVNQPATPSGSYASYSNKITLTGTNRPSGASETSSPSESASASASASDGRIVFSDNDVYTVIGGKTVADNSTASATSTGEDDAQPTNTQPCNNYVEFCERKYSNITYIGCHNSPFVRPGNAGSNQQLDVTAQLNDGVRFLQAQIQFPEGSNEPHFCHTSCDMLDAGPITDWLTEVRNWVARHPFDVVTIMLGNGNYSKPEVYAPYIESTGILQFAYEPPFLPMSLDDWPKLSEMIIRGKRVVMFMDYEADQTKYPWLLDEFSQMWETPFNPTNPEMPCDAQRPPDLPDDKARDRMFLYNHNLNVDYQLFGGSVLVPAVSELNNTNADEGENSLGENVPERCVSKWDRAPNIINLDYYNYGNYPGSVFEVAARANNVTYDRECCGLAQSAGPAGPGVSFGLLGALAVGGAAVLLM